MKKLLLILAVLLISNPAYSNNMASGIAIGMAAGTAISLTNHQESPLIEKLVECENGLKPELIPSRNLSFEQRYYDCKKLIDNRENWNNSYKTFQKSLDLFFVILVAILVSVLIYGIYDFNKH